MKKHFLIFLFFLIYAAGMNSAYAKTCDAELPVNDIRAMVDILSHPALGGRGTEQVGFDVAGLILARELRNVGLQPLPGIGGYMQPFSFSDHGQTIRSRNIIGYAQGMIPDEYIIIGAHYDHEGIKNGKMYPGADDNASGTAGVLAIAQQLAACVASGRKLNRSVIIGFWGAEEWGLHGSAYFVKSGIVPLDQIVAVLNLDMIGRNDPQALSAIGTEYPPEFPQKSPLLEKILRDENAKLDEPFTIEYSAQDMGYFSATDSYSFFEASPSHRRIPILFLTSGAHADYHRPTDTADKIDVEKLQNVARLMYRVAMRVITSPVWPVYLP
ncbi:MAG: M20/M25/M40 family metallo-hydrolase [bacterium]|nr:M20/M25/M40 family metallo-hydrolase [bacterium]